MGEAKKSAGEGRIGDLGREFSFFRARPRIRTQHQEHHYCNGLIGLTGTVQGRVVLSVAQIDGGAVLLHQFQNQDGLPPCRQPMQSAPTKDVLVHIVDKYTRTAQDGLHHVRLVVVAGQEQGSPTPSVHTGGDQQRVGLQQTVHCVHFARGQGIIQGVEHGLS